VLRLTRIEEGACYVNKYTRIYVAWMMLRYSAKIFWGCETINKLDQVNFFEDRPFPQDYDYPHYFEGIGTLMEMTDLFKGIESPVLDAFRIVTCFENFFKAKLLLENCVIHEIDFHVCKNHYPQFLNENGNNLLQKKTPIKIVDIKRAENQDIVHSAEPLETLSRFTLKMSRLLNEPSYQAIYSVNHEPNARKIFSILKSLNRTRNTLHFLTTEYISMGGIPLDDFRTLRDFVSSQIDALIVKIENENSVELESGRLDVQYGLPNFEESGKNSKE
jgi:hypothetical protein